MGLKEQIKDDIKTAMRNKENQKRDTLRNIQTAIKQIEVDERRELGDEEVEKILMKYTKQREEALAQFAQAGRDDLVAKEKEELMIVQSYLPEPLGDEELESILREIITATGATTVKDMGKVMSAAKESIGSKADGSRINQIVKKLLA
jgi:uncharacterized protein YqeY